MFIHEETEFEICPNYPNYAINKAGTKVLRIDTMRYMTPNLRGRSDTTLYWTVRTCHNNKAHNSFVHKMVADAWLSNDDPLNKIQVNHIDGDKYNNHISNLEWVTASQNQRHAVATGLKGVGDELYNASYNEETCHELCRRLADGARPKDLAKEFNLSVDAVRKLREGSTWFHIRKLYNIPIDYKSNFSEETVRWVCERILEGISDKNISLISTNKDLTCIDVKRIRHHIRYREITKEYF